MNPRVALLEQSLIKAQAQNLFKLEPNYRGLPKLDPGKFTGSESDYRTFKLKFKNVFENRNITKVELALHLQNSVDSKVEKVLKPQYTYEHLWRILDQHYGGRNREEQYVVGLLRKAEPLTEMTTKSITKLFECFHCSAKALSKRRS